MNPNSFELLLFSTHPPMIRQAVAAGVRGIMVDWEYLGKEARQADADTQINRDTVNDLHRVRAATRATVICRLNRWGETTASEVEQAIEAGADEILLPMVRSVNEVEQVLRRVSERCRVGILVETVEAIRIASELSQLPLARVYVGLNDLAIDRRAPGIFTALIDGTVERVRESFGIPFGFGGLTLPDHGQPVPCRLLINEMARLDCGFSFLRRSFHRDIQGHALNVEIPRLLKVLDEARQRTPEQIALDRTELVTTISVLVNRTAQADLAAYG